MKPSWATRESWPRSNGVVTSRNVDTGHLTVAGAQGEPLFIVARSDIVTVTVGVPEMYAAAVDPGDPAVIRLQAIPGKPLDGKVSRTAYALESKSHTWHRDRLAQPGREAPPGLICLRIRDCRRA